MNRVVLGEKEKIAEVGKKEKKPSYDEGDIVQEIIKYKRGEVIFIYRDAYELSHWWPMNRFHYWVEYEDGTMDRCIEQGRLRLRESRIAQARRWEERFNLDGDGDDDERQ